MAIHLTPTELARESGLERKEVIAKCMELGVPIFQGRIDKTLFLASLGHSTRYSTAQAATASSSGARGPHRACHGAPAHRIAAPFDVVPGGERWRPAPPP